MRWILGALILLAAGLTLQLGLLVYAMYALLGIIAVSRFLTHTWVESLAAERESLVPEAQIGDKAAIKVTLKNRGALPIPWLLLEDSLPGDALNSRPKAITTDGAWLRVVQLAPRGEHTMEYEVEFHRRGYYQIGPLLAETGDLFGLHRNFRVLTEPQFVLVYPKLIPLEGYDILSRRPIGEVRMTHRLFEDPTRISGVRQYQPGDPLNRVHWRATARTGELQSKTYDASCIAGATILLDFHRDSFKGAGDVYRADLAITAVASLANAICQMGEQVGFITNGRDAADRIRLEGWRHDFRTRNAARQELHMTDQSERLRPVIVETLRAEEQLDQILRTLARVEHTDGLPFAHLVYEVESRLPRDATVIAILTDVTEETAIALGTLHRGGFAVTAIVITFEESTYRDWAQPPEWAGRLLAEGIDFRWVNDEPAIAHLCSERMVR
ncbi:MAG: DUF58 domain-containing protein [Verrucomicrobiota bacterium]